MTGPNSTFFVTHVIPVLDVLTHPLTQLGLVALVFLLGLATAVTDRPLLLRPLSWLLGAAIAVTSLSFMLNFMGSSLGTGL